MDYTILIVDDSELQRVITEMVIKKSRSAVRIVSFPSATDALDHLRTLENHNSKFPDVIFLDIHMPIMDGFDFLDKYLEFSDDIRSQCKIVMLSATDSDADHDRIQGYPVVYKFINKPMTNKALNDLAFL